MAHYQIYIPKVKGANDNHFRAAGLDHLAEVGGATWVDCHRGPDGGHGLIAGWPSASGAPPSLKFQEGDRWEKLACGEAEHEPWIGFVGGETPTPEDLKVTEQFAGNWVALGDDQDWLVPHAHALPHRHRLIDGEWSRVISSKYEAFYDKANQIFGEIAELLDIRQYIDKPAHEAPKTVHDLTLHTGDTFVCDALALNYRLCPPIIDAMELLDDTSIRKVVVTVVDLEEILTVQDDKKKADSVAIPVG